MWLCIAFAGGVVVWWPWLFSLWACGVGVALLRSKWKRGTITVVARGDEVTASFPLGMGFETCFRLTSISKQFVTVAMLILAQDGLLSLDDPVSKYIPSLSWSRSTLFHLLAHTSDIADCYDHVNEDVEYTNKTCLRLLESNQTEPGSCYAYSDTGYDISVLVIEAATGSTFSDFLRTRITGPLQMTRTFTVEDGGDAVPSYSATTGEPYAYHHLNRIIGSGGIVSCPRDLLRWNRGMRDLVALDVAHSEVTPEYGLGWEVYPDRVAHSGCWEGYNTYLAFYPATNTSVVVLANVDDVDADGIGRKLADT
jgi:CubicO group peptidase (beta-lactamase class C family)